MDSPFQDNIWGADLADIQLMSKFDKGIRFVLSLIDIYSKYTLAIPLKDKKGITITNAFRKFQKYLVAAKQSSKDLNQTKYE